VKIFTIQILVCSNLTVFGIPDRWWWYWFSHGNRSDV